MTGKKPKQVLQIQKKKKSTEKKSILSMFINFKYSLRRRDIKNNII